MTWQYAIDGKNTDISPTGAQMLAKLKNTHPRVMVDETAVARFRHILNAEPHAPRWYDHIKAEADAVLSEAPSHYEIPDGRRLLSVSRRVKERVRDLMFVYMLDGGEQYADRAWAEAEAACGFQDWNPSHFLDTAEMTHAIAMVYDWLYDRWTDKQRRLMRQAIVEKGLKPGLQVYRGEVSGNRWHLNHNNWNQVCNGGLSIGALAIGDEEPEIAADILGEAIRSIPLPMGHYAPDGAGTEGVTYWDYGSRYNILYLSALETALGTDYGLSQIPGFRESGQYQMYICGAGRMAFNFADSGLRRMGTPMHFWMGRKFAMPAYSWFRYSDLASGAQSARVLDFLWFDDSGAQFDPSGLVPDKHFRGAEVASMRSSWAEDALVLGIQAGDNANLGSHRHIDLGSFILDAQGERWIMDPGTERETYQRHRNRREKWEFYRIRAEGHNVLVLNPGEGPEQKLDAVAPISGFESASELAKAVVDLSVAYSDHAQKVVRTFEMKDRRRVVMTDVLEAKDHVDLWWFLHTEADVELDASLREAVLRRNGKTLVVKIEDGPSLAEFEVRDAAPLPTSPNPEQASNEGIRKLVVHIEDVLRFKLVVSFTPGEA